MTSTTRPVVVRLPAALASVAAVGATYWAGRELVMAAGIAGVLLRDVLLAHGSRRAGMGADARNVSLSASAAEAWRAIAVSWFPLAAVLAVAVYVRLSIGLVGVLALAWLVADAAMSRPPLVNNYRSAASWIASQRPAGRADERARKQFNLTKEVMKGSAVAVRQRDPERVAHEIDAEAAADSECLRHMEGVVGGSCCLAREASD
jgi:hypothetical protein